MILLKIVDIQLEVPGAIGVDAGIVVLAEQAPPYRVLRTVTIIRRGDGAPGGIVKS